MRDVLKVRYQYTDADIVMLKTIFAGIIRREVLQDKELELQRLDNIAKFRSRFEDNIFQDEYAILYELVIRRGVTTGSWDVYNTILDENKAIILGAPQVDLYRVAVEEITTEDDKFTVYKQVVQEAYEEICDMDFIGSEGFKSHIVSFIDVYKTKHLRSCLHVQNRILNATQPLVDYRGGVRREYIGAEGYLAFAQSEKLKLDKLSGGISSKQYVLDQEWLLDNTDEEKAEEDRKKLELLCELGLPHIDNIWSGLRRTHMIGIMGPPKGGKTTLSGYCVYKLLEAGRRVAIWAMEGSAQESWINKLIVSYCFDAQVDIEPRDLVNGLEGLDERAKQVVNNAKAKIAQNQNLSFIEDTGYAEDFIDVIKGHYDVYNQFDCLVVDSLVNLQSRTGLPKTTYLSGAYMRLKNHIAQDYDRAPCCIATAQFKQEAIKDARKQVAINFDETSGGETAETLRTPDEVLGIFSTPAQRDVGMTTIHHIASRHSELFKPLDARMEYKMARLFSV